MDMTTEVIVYVLNIAYLLTVEWKYFLLMPSGTVEFWSEVKHLIYDQLPDN